MGKVWKKSISFFLMMCLGFSMIFSVTNVQASAEKEDILKKASRNIEPDEWNKEEIKAYQFDSEEKIMKYMLTGGMKYYNKNFKAADQMVKVVIEDEGIFFLDSDCDSKSKIILYDAEKKIISRDAEEYVHPVKVKKGEIFYIKLPNDMKEAVIQVYVWKSDFSNLKNGEEYYQTGTGKETYHNFTVKKRSLAEIDIYPVSSKGGAINAYLQKNEKGKWKTIGKKVSISQKSKNGKECCYGLTPGTYRFVLKSSPAQTANIEYYRETVKKKVAYKKSKAKNIKFDNSSRNIYTTDEKAVRWYKISVNSVKEQRCLNFYRDAQSGGFKFTIYKKGQKKAWKTKNVKSSKGRTVNLPKKKGTYYIKVSKIGKKTNGAYMIYYGEK